MRNVYRLWAEVYGTDGKAKENITREVLIHSQITSPCSG